MKNKIAMFKRWVMILCGKTSVALKQGIGKAYRKGGLAGYYNDLTGKVSETTPLDDEGIPVTIMAGDERVYFPIAIFQYGLGCYDLYLITRDDKFKRMFCKIVSWAERNIKSDGSWDCFLVLKSEKYNVSSMCQAEGASLLYRAYQISSDDKYKRMAESAIDFMLSPIEWGGTTVYSDGDIFFEEYPQKDRRSVLNGWIFSIFGLLDAKIVNPDKYGEQLSRAINTIIKSLSDYDMKIWSKYDRSGNIASPAYHDLHIMQLHVLYDLFEREEFLCWAKKFENYKANRTFTVLAVIAKAIQKIFAKSEMVIIR